MSLEEITNDLLTEGLKSFKKSFDKLLATLKITPAKNFGYSLEHSLEKKVEANIAKWQEANTMNKIWTKDASLWTGQDEAQWLGWLTVVQENLSDIEDLEKFVSEVKNDGFTDVLLLGMGGSSLSSVVMAQTFKSESTVSTDYPIYAEKAGLPIKNKIANRAILLCGSGIGISFAANKMPGIRAGICHDTYSAHQGVEHYDMNILVIGAGIIGTKLTEEIVEVFIHATFSKAERFLRRLEQVADLEEKYSYDHRRKIHPL